MPPKKDAEMSSLIAAGETFDGTWPYTAHYGEAAGFRQHYVDEGPQDPEHTLVLLHGEPTWGYLWRHLIGALSQRNRVIVPDHMGFGEKRHPVRPHLSGRRACRQPRYVPEEVGTWNENYVDTALADLPHTAEHMKTLTRLIGGGGYLGVTDQLETLLGRPPKTVRWALENNPRIRTVATS